MFLWATRSFHKELAMMMTHSNDAVVFSEERFQSTKAEI